MTPPLRVSDKARTEVRWRPGARLSASRSGAEAPAVSCGSAFRCAGRQDVLDAWGEIPVFRRPCRPSSLPGFTPRSRADGQLPGKSRCVSQSGVRILPHLAHFVRLYVLAFRNSGLITWAKKGCGHGAPGQAAVRGAPRREARQPRRPTTPRSRKISDRASNESCRPAERKADLHDATGASVRL